MSGREREPHHQLVHQLRTQNPEEMQNLLSSLMESMELIEGQLESVQIEAQKKVGELTGPALGIHSHVLL